MVASNLKDAEARITVMEDNIELKVDKGGVIQAIRISTEGVQIQASKVDLGDYATVGALNAVSGDIRDLRAGELGFTKLIGSRGEFNSLYLSGSQLSRTTLTVEGVSHNFVTWYG